MTPDETRHMIARVKELHAILRNGEKKTRLVTSMHEFELACCAHALALALETALAEVEKLNRALGQYGAHSGGCNVWSNHMECNCGFRSCLEGTKEKLC